MNPSFFYESLTETEKLYWQRLADLFQMVNPQKPEKGIKALILKARISSVENDIPYEQALEDVFQGAKERTLRRVELLSQCPVNNLPIK
jgi:hypothetical protein